jgi:hypothetical protein
MSDGLSHIPILIDSHQPARRPSCGTTRPPPNCRNTPEDIFNLCDFPTPLMESHHFATF